PRVVTPKAILIVPEEQKRVPALGLGRFVKADNAVLGHIVPSGVDLGCDIDDAGFVERRVQIWDRSVIDTVIGAQRSPKGISDPCSAVAFDRRIDATPEPQLAGAMFMPGLHSAAGRGPLIDSIARDLVVLAREKIEHERRDRRWLFVSFFARAGC